MTDEDLKVFYEVMKIYEVSNVAGVVPNPGVKRKSEYLGGLDTQHYGRGKRAREVGLLHLIPLICNLLVACPTMCDCESSCFFLIF